jgi:prepilin-type processing-associated H-X9-DG protein
MSESGIHWMEPRDLQFDQMEFNIYAPTPLRSSSGRGSRQALSSAHPGGIQAVFADGHVDFLPTKTSREVLREMLLIGEGEEEANRKQSKAGEATHVK